MADDDLQQRLFRELLQGCYEYEPGSADGEAGRLRARFGGLLDRWAQRAGFSRRHFDPSLAARRLAEAVGRLDGLERTYALLCDERSRALLVDLVKLRILGPGHTRLPVTRARLRAEEAAVERELLEERATVALSQPGASSLNRYRLPDPAGPRELHGHPTTLVEVFVFEQYAYDHPPTVIRAEPGDVVIDAGACWGDTALYLAGLVGSEGRVYAFEFSPENLPIIERNLALNEELARRVEVVEAALWDTSGEVLDYSASGTFTSLAADRKVEGDQRVSTVTIDDFVRDRELRRIDLIKMDVEGAEPEALRGAEQTLREHRPALAIAAYHRPTDLTEIPRFIHDLDLGYELFLDHFSPSWQETVLFARPRRP